MKSLNKNTRRLLVRFTGLAAVSGLLLLSMYSMGWFTSNTENDVNSLDMGAAYVPFELGTADSKVPYDFNTTNLDYIKANDGENKTFIDENGDSLNLSITADGTDIKWLINENSNFSNTGNDESDGLHPGSRGIISFYVIPKKDGAINANFNLDLALYDSDESKIDDENIINFAQGHLLFFQNYDENSKIYSDIINNTFSFENNNSESGTAYRTDIYWIWPDVVDELILPAGDPLFTGESYRIISEKSAVDSDADILYEHMFGNPEYYFYDDSQVSIDKDSFSNVCGGSKNADFDTDYYKTLNKMWDNADQIIGTSAAYIELKLSAY
ncbi:MAG: hypothetical protein ACI4JN_09340 [Ruminococcus sp.]